MGALRSSGHMRSGGMLRAYISGTMHCSCYSICGAVGEVELRDESEGGKERESDDSSEQGCASCATRERRVKGDGCVGSLGTRERTHTLCQCVRCVHLPIRMREV